METIGNPDIFAVQLERDDATSCLLYAQMGELPRECRGSRTVLTNVQAEWDAVTLPGLVRLRLVFPPDDARHWPDIVAPMRK